MLLFADTLQSLTSAGDRDKTIIEALKNHFTEAATAGFDTVVLPLGFFNLRLRLPSITTSVFVSDEVLEFFVGEGVKVVLLEIYQKRFLRPKKFLGQDIKFSWKKKENERI